MVERNTTFLIQNRQRGRRIDAAALRLFCDALAGCVKPPPFTVGVVIVSDAVIKRLNRRHLGKSGATDIMSFADSSSSGELVISADTAARNARRFGATFTGELCYLVVHGFLHLQGQRDETAAEYGVMKRRQDALFRKVNSRCCNG